jgi:hypothetical protein
MLPALVRMKSFQLIGGERGGGGVFSGEGGVIEGEVDGARAVVPPL